MPAPFPSPSNENHAGPVLPTCINDPTLNCSSTRVNPGRYIWQSADTNDQVVDKISCKVHIQRGNARQQAIADNSTNLIENDLEIDKGAKLLPCPPQQKCVCRPPSPGHQVASARSLDCRL